MGFFSVLGNVLFASLIIFSAWQMFNGPGDEKLDPKLDLAKAHAAHLPSRLWVTLSNIEVKQAGVTIVSLIALGGLLFVIGKLFGASPAFYFAVVSPVLYDIYNYGPEDRHFSPFWMKLLLSIAQFGAFVLFFME